ncbi:MAG: pyridoxal-phosphate dependent enzyme [Actinomycetota bacterium]
MAAGSTLVGLACLRCGRSPEGGHPATGCARCAGEGAPASLTTVYDLEAAARTLTPQALAQRPPGPLRYRELLPVEAEEAVALGEGGTPLLSARRLAEELGVREVWIKDESRNPTWSFKDRAASIAASIARRERAAGLVVSSTGNAAAATAAYSRVAGLPAVVLFAMGVDPVMAGMVHGFGLPVLATPTKKDRWVLMRHGVEELGLFPNSNFADPPVGVDPRVVDGYKAMGLEIWEQLGHRAPDAVYLPVGYGDGLFGAYKAFRELGTMGLAEVPRFSGGEVYGSLSAALGGSGERVDAVPVDRPTVASSIATAQSTYQALHAVRSSGGAVRQVSEEEIVEAQRLLVAAEGLFVEASSAAGLAALRADVADGAVSGDAEVVVVSTSAGVKSVSALGLTEREAPVVTGIEEFSRLVVEMVGRATEGEGG